MREKKKKRGGTTGGCGQAFELAAMSLGFRLVAGADEAGRGPLAGPVVAAAVILKRGAASLGIDDSKKLPAVKREALYQQIIDNSVAYSVHTLDASKIDEINIYQASLLAMKLAIESLPARPDFAYIDGPKRPNLDIPSQPLIGGDRLCMSVAAASILAKTERDRMMRDYDAIYPGYGFAKHKGYGTRAHLEALRELGPSPIHRKTFGPVAMLLI